MPVVSEGRTPLGLRRKNFEDEGAYNELRRVLRLLDDVLQNLAIGVNSHELVFGCVSRGERTSDPPDPGEGNWVMWMSDGSGSGRDGDLMTKVTFGGVTRLARIRLEISITPLSLTCETAVGLVHVAPLEIGSELQDVISSAVVEDATIATSFAVHGIAPSNVVGTGWVGDTTATSSAFEFVDEPGIWDWIDDGDFVFIPPDELIANGDDLQAATYVEPIVLRQRSATGAWYLRINDMTSAGEVAEPRVLGPIKPVDVIPSTTVEDAWAVKRSSTGAYYIKVDNVTPAASVADATVTKV